MNVPMDFDTFAACVDSIRFDDVCAAASESLAHVSDEDLLAKTMEWDEEWAAFVSGESGSSSSVPDAAKVPSPQWEACAATCTCGGTGWTLPRLGMKPLHFNASCPCMRKVHVGTLPFSCIPRQKHETLEKKAFEACGLPQCPCNGQGFVSIEQWHAPPLTNVPAQYRVHVWPDCHCVAKTHVVPANDDDRQSRTVSKCLTKSYRKRVAEAETSASASA